MANRPPFLCELEKGKFVDTQFGFVDTFNWAVRAIDNLEGGKNCEVEWVDDDHPVINVDLPEDFTEGGGAANISAVYDVQAATGTQGEDGIEISYVDERENTFIPFPSSPTPPPSVSSEVQFTGTDSTTTSKTDSFTFAHANNSQVTVTCNGSTITLGVYYI